VCELAKDRSMQGTQTVNAPPAGDAPGQTAAEARLQRNLKIVVVALGVLIFAGLATAVGRIIYLASAKPAQPVASAASVPLPSGAGLQLPAEAQVRSISLSGDRLAVHYEAQGAEGVAVIDLATGQPVASVGITRAAPK
jgi:hypothetical protein